MPDSYEVVRLPPPHQRLAEVNFDINPDTSIVFFDREDSPDEPEEEDDDMEEVVPEAAPREMDEDYDD